MGSKDNQIKYELPGHRIKILGSFVMESDDQSRKRQSALKEINRINSGATQ